MNIQRICSCVHTQFQAVWNAVESWFYWLKDRFWQALDPLFSFSDHTVTFPGSVPSQTEVTEVFQQVIAASVTQVPSMIEVLNNDCLELVAKHSRTLNDLIALSQTCHTWKVIIEKPSMWHSYITSPVFYHQDRGSLLALIADYINPAGLRLSDFVEFTAQLMKESGEENNLELGRIKAKEMSLMDFNALTKRVQATQDRCLVMTWTVYFHSVIKWCCKKKEIPIPEDMPQRNETDAQRIRAWMRKSVAIYSDYTMFNMSANRELVSLKKEKEERVFILPVEFRLFSRLTELDLSDTLVEQIPFWVGDFRELRILLCYNSAVKDLPDTITQCPLERLIMFECHNLTTIPEQVQAMPSLIFLNLANCPNITSVPLWFKAVQERTRVEWPDGSLTGPLLPEDLPAVEEA